jgi:hypothetical protein
MLTEAEEDTRAPKRYFRKLYGTVRSVDSSYKSRKRRRNLYGWRMSVLLGSCASAFVLLCNIALVIIGQKRSAYDKDRAVTLLEGDEVTISRWNNIIHIAINALSTILLSMSNYTPHLWMPALQNI